MRYINFILQLRPLFLGNRYFGKHACHERRFSIAGRKLSLLARGRRQCERGAGRPSAFDLSITEGFVMSFAGLNRPHADLATPGRTDPPALLRSIRSCPSYRPACGLLRRRPASPLPALRLEE
jgi:hypothetical protein